MKKRVIATFSMFMFACIPAFAQLDQINIVKTNYLNWRTDAVANYSVGNVKSISDRFIANGNAAEVRISSYDFSNLTPWDFNVNTDQAAFVNLVNTNLFPLVSSYWIKGAPVNGQPSNADYQSPALKATILKIFTYIRDKGVSWETDFEKNLGFMLRSEQLSIAILLMKETLVEAGQYDHFMGVLSKYTNVFDENHESQSVAYPGMNTDVIRSLMESRLAYIFAMQDTDVNKIAEMERFVRISNNALHTANGWSDCFKPDMITYHHRGAYANTYGIEGTASATLINMMLKNTAYELDAAAQNNIKGAIFAYLKFSADFEMHRGLAGRFPTNVTALQYGRFLFSYLYKTDPLANSDAASYFKYLYNLPGGGYNSSATQDNPIMAVQYATETNALPILAASIDRAHSGFPYAGLSAHKYNGNLASVKGTSKHIWHYENGPTENRFGRYISAGAMELVTNGMPKNRAASGLGVNGWDWSHLPGTTVAYLTPEQLNTGVAREMNDKMFLANATFGNNGIFAIDYKDINSPTGMTAKKSNFFFDDKILCLGSDINDVGGTDAIHTTLFQTQILNNATNFVNGAEVGGNSYNFSQSTGSYWGTDAVGNGFVIPAGTIDGTLVIERASQTQPLQNGSSTQTGDYATAYINHGTAPVAKKYVYATVLQGGASTTKNLADNFADYFTVSRQDERAHIVKYVPTNTDCFVIFDRTLELPTGDVKKVDFPSVVMTKKSPDGNNIDVSLTNPDLGLLQETENFTWREISRTPSILNRVPQTRIVKLTINGKWELAGNNADVSATIVGEQTELSFSTTNGKTIQTQLVAANTLPIAFINPTATNDDNCNTILKWDFDADGYKIDSFEIKHHTNGKNWKTLATLPASQKSFKYKSASKDYYQIGAVINGKSVIESKVFTTGGSKCYLDQQTVVFPNPTQSLVTITLGRRIDLGKVKIFASNGQDVSQQVTLQHADVGLQANLEKLNAGIYFLKMDSEIFKVIKR